MLNDLPVTLKYGCYICSYRFMNQANLGAIISLYDTLKGNRNINHRLAGYYFIHHDLPEHMHWYFH